MCTTARYRLSIESDIFKLKIKKIYFVFAKKNSKFSLGYLIFKTRRQTVQLPSKAYLCFSDSMTLSKI
jgi:hypothetical protein